MSKVLDGIYRIIMAVMLITLVIMVGSVTYNVIARYFGKALMWIDEVSRLAFVWMAFTAIIIGFKDNLHPSFEILVEKAGTGILKKVMLTVINLLILVFLIFALKGGVDYTMKSLIQKTAILGISVGWKYAAVPFAAFMMSLECIRKLVVVWVPEKKTESKDVYKEAIEWK